MTEPDVPNKTVLERLTGGVSPVTNAVVLGLFVIVLTAPSLAFMVGLAVSETVTRFGIPFPLSTTFRDVFGLAVFLGGPLSLITTPLYLLILLIGWMGCARISPWLLVLGVLSAFGTCLYFATSFGSMRLSAG